MITDTLTSKEKMLRLRDITAIEWVVMVAIIAILAVMIAPAVKMAREAHLKHERNQHYKYRINGLGTDSYEIDGPFVKFKDFEGVIHRINVINADILEKTHNENHRKSY